MKAWVDRGQERVQESDVNAGTLFSSGLIAGGSIAGILFAVLVGSGAIGPFQRVGNWIPWFHGDTLVAELASAALFLGLAVWLARVSRRPVE